ncbi:putative Glycosyltransferase [Candidatus Accumulibacter aalborgensis]|uniref:Putative Glycosyltransferase n=1 Tax=Candidatus Accumulibacter aalborgensis TaxID=1860102 RepID=A0A1A8XTV2_9PROT|nr:glycosyltransferase [Candidatus Accumulibacter aalborgensis]SBT08504.1 putative Glycosyltransferase [Candidatus Accumulibacter aalborgensis]
MAKREKILLFFTGLYPYGRQEAFIENEIPFLAECFDHICLLPQFSADSCREVPRNVAITPLPEIRSWKKAATIISRAALSMIFWRNIHETMAGCDILYRLRTLASYVGLAGVYKDFVVSKVIQKLPKDADIYLYSYWMDRNALTMFFIREQISVKKIVCRVHRFDVYEEINPDSYLPLRALLLRRIDTVHSISKHAVDYLESRYPGLANYEISRLGTTRGDFHEHIQKESNVFHIVSVSNVIPVKRVQLILESVQSFSRLAPLTRVKWTHFGDGLLFEDLKRQVSEIDLQNLAIDLRGGQLNAVVKQFYEQTPVDLFINLSESEGIPVSFMEAMSFSVPVLATNVGGVGEILDPSCGYLLTGAITADQVAARIHEIATDPVQLRALSARALAVWKDKYSADTTYRSFCDNLLSAM